MSRRRSSSTTMGPPVDVVMGPPPPPPLPVPQQPPPAPPKDNLEIVDKYRRLKRKYFELEDVSSYPPSSFVSDQPLSPRNTKKPRMN